MFPPAINVPVPNPRRPWVNLVGAILATAAGIFLTLLLFDVVMHWSVYSWIYQRLRGLGVNEYLSGAAAVWLMAAVAWFFPSILVSFLKRDKSWIWKTATFVSVWFLLMFALNSWWTRNQLFSTYTGGANFRFNKNAEGVIKKWPLGYMYDPETGDKLEYFTPPVAKEYLKQESLESIKRKTEVKATPPPEENPSKTAMVAPSPVSTVNKASNYVRSSNANDNLNLWVERMTFSPDHIILHMAVHVHDENVNGGRGELAIAPSGASTYLVDDLGNTYDWQRSSVRVANFQGSYERRRLIRQDETFRFTAEFAPAKPNVKHMKLFHSQFESVTIDDALITSAVHVEVQPNLAEQAVNPDVAVPPVVKSSRNRLPYVYGESDYLVESSEPVGEIESTIRAGNQSPINIAIAQRAANIRRALEEAKAAAK